MHFTEEHLLLSLRLAGGQDAYSVAQVTLGNAPAHPAFSRIEVRHAERYELLQTRILQGNTEIQDLLRKTGADSYLDEEAAVRYLVYGEGSWIS